MIDLAYYHTLATDLGQNVDPQVAEIQDKLNSAKALVNTGDLENSMKTLREASMMLENLASNIIRDK
jgi:hypothetical protein